MDKFKKSPVTDVLSEGGDAVQKTSDSTVESVFKETRPLPMQNAIDIVNCSIVAAKERNALLNRQATDFAAALREELMSIKVTVIGDDLEQEKEESLIPEKKIHDYIQSITPEAKTLFLNLIEIVPSFDVILENIKVLIIEILQKLEIRHTPSDSEISDIADKLMIYIWPQPIQTYIKNMLLRESSIHSINLLELWHSAVETEDLTEEDAIKRLEYAAVKANEVSKYFTEKDKVYFCPEIEQTNDIVKLQKIWRDEDGFNIDSWKKKHGAFIKVSLMYAIHMIDGTINRREITLVTKEIRRRIETICVEYFEENGDEVVLLNPTADGEIGPDSLKIFKLFFNEKDEIDDYLKFITNLFSDDIAPDAHSTSDRNRFRGMLLEDPRKSHPDFEDLPLKVAKIAAATKFMAITMLKLGTTVDKRKVRNSINTGTGINNRSGRIHRALQWKGSVFIDRNPDGSLRRKAKSHKYEGQGILFVPEHLYADDVEEYRYKKFIKSQKVLGIGIDFGNDTLNLCDVFVNRYTFPHDEPSNRELAESAFGERMFQQPFMKEEIARKIIERIICDDEDTIQAIQELVNKRSSRKKIGITLDEIQGYIMLVKRHYLAMRYKQLSKAVDNVLMECQSTLKIKEIKDHFTASQAIEKQDLEERINEIDVLFDEDAQEQGVKDYYHKKYNYIRRLIKDIQFITFHGPSGLHVKLDEAKKRLSKYIHDIEEEDDESTYGQLSLFVDPE